MSCIGPGVYTGDAIEYKQFFFISRIQTIFFHFQSRRQHTDRIPCLLYALALRYSQYCNEKGVKHSPVNPRPASLMDSCIDLIFDTMLGVNALYSRLQIINLHSALSCYSAIYSSSYLFVVFWHLFLNVNDNYCYNCNFKHCPGKGRYKVG